MNIGVTIPRRGVLVGREGVLKVRKVWRASLNNRGGMDTLRVGLRKTMENVAYKRELILFGAFVQGREGVDRSDFVDGEIAKCVEEVERYKAGEITKEEIRFVPALLESLNCPNGEKLLDGIEKAVKANRRMVEANKIGKRLQSAVNVDEIEQLKERVAKL